jgi:AcrR family transcriptional regulator
MARTKKISDEQILEAARTVFSQRGFSATTSQIAAEAGISEGSIFRRWESKDELLITALGIPQPDWIDRVSAMADDERTVDEQLVELGTMLLDFFIENIPKMAAMVGCGVHMRQKIMRSHDSPPVQGVRAVTNYFALQRKEGRIRMTDPEIAARMFVGALHHYAFAEFAGLNDLMPMPRETYVRGIVDNLIRGIEQINE